MARLPLRVDDRMLDFDDPLGEPPGYDDDSEISDLSDGEDFDELEEERKRWRR